MLMVSHPALTHSDKFHPLGWVTPTPASAAEMQQKASRLYFQHIWPEASPGPLHSAVTMPESTGKMPHRAALFGSCADARQCIFPNLDTEALEMPIAEGRSMGSGCQHLFASKAMRERCSVPKHLLLFKTAYNPAQDSW